MVGTVRTIARCCRGLCALPLAFLSNSWEIARVDTRHQRKLRMVGPWLRRSPSRCRATLPLPRPGRRHAHPARSSSRLTHWPPNELLAPPGAPRCLEARTRAEGKRPRYSSYFFRGRPHRRRHSHGAVASEASEIRRRHCRDPRGGSTNS